MYCQGRWLCSSWVRVKSRVPMKLKCGFGCRGEGLLNPRP